MPALQKINGVEFVALCDAVKARAEEASASFGGKVYKDHRDLLEHAEVDALYVCLPPDAHDDVEVMAAAKKVHLFVEKPITMSMKEGLRAAEAIKKAGVVSCVGYQLRYTPAVQAARAFVAGKAVALVAGNRWGGIAGGPEHWWRVMKRSGGMFHEQATHNLDILRYVVGDIARVYARYSLNALKGVENLDIPDAQVILLEFKNGATGYFSASCALTKGDGWSSTDIVLRDLRLQLGYRELTVHPEGAATIELPPAGMDIDEAFIHAIRTGDRSVIRSDYWDALKTTEVTLGANESAKTGKPVEMKLA
jgi:predicted dehydrogenase